jgi:hypothetical protein
MAQNFLRNGARRTLSVLLGEMTDTLKSEHARVRHFSENSVPFDPNPREGSHSLVINQNNQSSKLARQKQCKPLTPSLTA